jgi:hypothetical protein
MTPMIHDLRMAWAFFKALRKWRRQGSGLVAIECRFEHGTTIMPPPMDTSPDALQKIAVWHLSQGNIGVTIRYRDKPDRIVHRRYGDHGDGGRTAFVDLTDPAFLWPKL